MPPDKVGRSVGMTSTGKPGPSHVNVRMSKIMRMPIKVGGTYVRDVR